MTVHTAEFTLKTKKAPHFEDITERVEKEIAKSNVKNGIVVVYSTHTTAAIRINEDETGIRRDFAKRISKLVPKDAYYAHNDLDIRTENLACGGEECLNGHSHIQQMLMGGSETIPIKDGEMTLGQWQKIFLMELDHPRPRKVVVQIMGE